MDNAQQPANWNQFVSFVKTKLDEQHQDAGKVLSTLYGYTSEEKGTHFERLRDAIADVSSTYNLSLSGNSIESIFQTAPFLVSEFSEPSTPTEEQGRKESKNESGTTSGGGMPSLRDKEKYQSEIVDTLAKQQQENAIEELNKAHERTLSQEQIENAKKDALEKLNKTQLSAAEESKAIEDYKRKEAFKEILTRNQTAENTIQEQHELLAKQLEKSGEGIQLKEGEVSAAERVRQRSAELAKERILERDNRLNEFSKIDQTDIKQLLLRESQKEKLSESERWRLKHYKNLQTLNEREERGNIHDIEGWVKRFGNLDKQHQEILLRQLIARQHRRTHWEVWKVFDKKQDPQKKGLKQLFSVKNQTTKILSRKERRNLLAYQKAELRKKQQTAIEKISILRRMLSLLSQDPEIDSQYVSSEFSDYRRNNNGNGGSGFNPFDMYQRVNNMYKNFNNAKKAFDFLRNLGQGAEALGGGSTAATAEVGAAGAASTPFWVIAAIVLFVIVVVVLVIVWFILNPPTTPPYAPPLASGYSLVQCGDNYAGSVNNTDAMQQFFYNKFGLGTSPLKNNSLSVFAPLYMDNTYANDIGFQQESRMYNITCILFGGIIGNPYSLKPNEYNMFGTGVVGSAQVRQSESDILKRTLHQFQLEMLVNYTDHNIQGLQDPIPCAIAYNSQKILQPTNNKNVFYTWLFHNPQQCGDPKEPNQNFRDGKFNFLMAQYLGHMFILQEQHAKTSDVFDTFVKQNLPQTDGPLPTDSCLNAKDYGESASDQQQRDCFADMVGLYVSYPFYYDAPGGTSPTATSSGSPLLDFPYGKFRDYYNFAKQYLFGGHNLIVPPDVTASCPSIPTDDATALAQLKTWGFTVGALDGLKLTSTVIHNVYQVICLDYQSDKFRQLVHADPSLSGANPIHIVFSNTACSGAGFTSLPSIYLCMRVKGDATAIDPTYDHLQYYLTHELGHVIQDRNSSIYTGWVKTFNAAQPPYLYTLNCNGHQGPAAHLNQIDECLADAIALYTTYGNFTDGSFGGFAPNPLTTYTTYNTKSEWNTYYQFVNQQIFNNTVFFSTSGADASTGNALADYATQLAKDIIHYCPSYDITRSTTNVHSGACLQSSSFPTYPAKVITQLVADIIPIGPHSQPSLQCVGFARASVLGQNNPFPSAPGGVASGYAGHAISIWSSSSNPNDYSGISITGYKWYSEKTLMYNNQGVLPGDVAIFANPDGFNHIAIVTKPLKSNGSGDFYVAEASGASGFVDANDIIYHFDKHFAGVYRLIK